MAKKCTVNFHNKGRLADWPMECSVMTAVSCIWADQYGGHCPMWLLSTLNATTGEPGSMANNAQV